MELGEPIWIPAVFGAQPDETSESKKEEKRVKVRISLFFDGTKNNARNTQLRNEKWLPKGIPEDVSKDDSSYGNDFSNVWRLEQYVGKNAAGYEHYFKLYVEGSGTTDGSKDSLLGLGLGTGPTGIETKVQRGIAKALSLVQEKVKSWFIIEKMSIDTGGFSRGAAAARHCVHRMLKTENFGRKVEKLEILAVCLFDTVSSHGLVYRNDVADLKLDAIGSAKAVLQLAAAEEYRQNFSLTNIDSAGRKGRQVYLPGAHADIGGGYVEGAGESKKIVTGDASNDIAKFLTDRGWYSSGGQDKNQNELHIGVIYTDPPTKYVAVNRKNISRKYSFIPLRIMADFAKAQGIPVQSDLFTECDPGELPGRGRIESYAKSVGCSKPSDWEASDETLEKLRHRHLHISFSADNTGMQVRMINNGSFWKPHYRPHRHWYR